MLKKKTTWRKLLSLICVATLVLTVVLSTAFTGNKPVVAAGGATQSETVLFEEDYSDADANGVTPGHLKLSSCDFVPVTIPSAIDTQNFGKAMRYKASWYGKGALYLGHNYATLSQADVYQNSVAVEKGATYNIEFDYYIEANEAAEATFKLYFTAGKTVAAGSISADTTNGVLIKSYSTGETPTDAGTWQHVTKSITFGDNYDITAYPYLMLYVTGGDYHAIYVDNVKVSKEQPKESEYIFEGDYSSADTDLTPGHLLDSSVDFTPKTIPSEIDTQNFGKAMKYKASWYPRGALYLGHNYVEYAQAKVYENAIEVEQATKYTVEFDYYLDAPQPCQAAFKFYLTAGKSLGESIISADTNNGVLIRSHNVATIPEEAGSWQKITQTIVFPENYDTTAYPYLMLYATGGDNHSIYVDNVKVKKAAATPEDLNGGSSGGGDDQKGDGDGVYDVKFVTNGGDPIADMKFNLVTTNTVFRYKQSRFADGQLILGADYKSSDSQVAAQGITPEAGATYDVEFDYYIKGKVSDEALKIGLGVGNATENEVGDPLYVFTKEFLSYNAFSSVDTGGWQRDAKFSITVPASANITNENKLLFYFTGGATGQTGVLVHIDNVKVSKGGQVIFECDYTDARIGNDAWTFPKSSGDSYPVNDPLAGVGMLPTPTHESGIFVEWCTDAELKNPVTEDSFKKDQVLTLYARWRFYADDLTINVDDTDAYWHVNGEREDDTRMDIPITVADDGGNKVLKYYMDFTMDKASHVYNASKSETGAWDRWAFGLFDPNVFKNDSTATREDAAYLVKEGATYYVSFKYKALRVDDTSNCKTRINFNLLVTGENSMSTGKFVLGNFTGTSHTPDTEWKTAHINITVPSLEGVGNRLAIGCMGFGEVLIDDIRVIRVQNGLVFDTDGGSAVVPVYGNVGDKYSVPANPTRENSKFLGWYEDANFTKAYNPSGVIAKGVKKLYAKFLTYQTVQDFEDYELGKSYACEHVYWINKLTNDTTWIKNKNWLGSQFVADGVRNGKASIYHASIDGSSAYRAMLFDINTPLTVGEEYILSAWVKIEDMMFPGSINIVFTDDLSNARGGEWSESLRGPRSISVTSTAVIEDYVGEWVEVQCKFVASAKYISIEAPSLTNMYIDDVCITLASAPDTYSRTIAGDGVTWDEASQIKVSGDEGEETEVKKIIIKYASLETNSESSIDLWLIIAIAGAAVIVIGIIVALIIVFKKKAKKG